MTRSVLITGGAGFLGSHLADRLLARDWRVRVLDALVPQVHGPARTRPAYLEPEVELQVGDVRDPDAVARAMRGVDAVVHFAAVVGVGQSMYESTAYTDVNCTGTSVVCEQAVRHGVGKLLVASSMSIYGEGAYLDADGRSAAFTSRPAEQLTRGDWEPRGQGGRPLRPIPTPETKAPAPASVYALTKLYQERICLNLGAAYRIPTVAVRFFNAYGPRQSLANPYTGVLAIFASRLLRGEAPLVYEDGHQRRDFVSVHDIADACALALEREGADGHVLNIGSGAARSVLDVAQAMAAAVGRRQQPQVLHRYRVGDIRHCYADITRAQQLLGWSPRVTFERGVHELARWLEGCMPTGTLADAQRELEHRGLAI